LVPVRKGLEVVSCSHSVFCPLRDLVVPCEVVGDEVAEPSHVFLLFLDGRFPYVPVQFVWIWGLDVQALCFGSGEGVSQAVSGCFQFFLGFLGGFLSGSGLLV